MNEFTLMERMDFLNAHTQLLDIPPDEGTCMTVFLREPEYVFGCLGFLTSRPVRRGVIWLGASLSALAVILAPLLLLLHRTTSTLVGQTLFLVICAWIF